MTPDCAARHERVASIGNSGATLQAVAFFCLVWLAWSGAQSTLPEYAARHHIKQSKIRIVPIHVGDRAPAITAATWLNSPGLTERELNGRVVVLDFWATWCQPCVHGLPAVVSLARQLDKLPVSVVAVHYKADAETVTAFARLMNLRFPIAVDTGATWEAFGIDYLPTYLILDKEGVVRFKSTEPPTRYDVESLLRP